MSTPVSAIAQHLLALTHPDVVLGAEAAGPVREKNSVSASSDKFACRSLAELLTVVSRTGVDQGSKTVARVETQRSRPRDGGRREWKITSRPSLRIAGRASSVALLSSVTKAGGRPMVSRRGRTSRRCGRCRRSRAGYW